MPVVYRFSDSCCSN